MLWTVTGVSDNFLIFCSALMMYGKRFSTFLFLTSTSRRSKCLPRWFLANKNCPNDKEGRSLKAICSMQQCAFYKGASLRECSPAWHLRRQRPSAHPPPSRSPQLRSSSSWRWSRGSSGHRASPNRSRRFLHRCRRCSLLKQGGLLMFSGHSQKNNRVRVKPGWR